MQLHTLHHIHDGAAAIKAACAYIGAFVDPQYRHTHPHTHAWIGVGLYKEPAGCHNTFCLVFDRKLQDFSDNDKPENRIK